MFRPTAIAATIALSISTFSNCLAEVTFEELLEESPIREDIGLQEALTPTRLAQPRREIPASVTIIDKKLIENTGIREIHELFRLVPGISVGSRDGWNHVVSYHGTNYRDSRRMQVLIDGRSIYQAGQATVDWASLPITIQDIERVEVNRGPNTAAYGANAFLGVINIITRDARDFERLSIETTHGSDSTHSYQASFGIQRDSWAMSLSASSTKDSGFDQKESGIDRRDGKRMETLNAKFHTNLGSDWALKLHAGFANGSYQDDIFDVSMQSYPDQELSDYYVSVKLNRTGDYHSFSITADHTNQDRKLDWRACLPPVLFGLPTHPDPLLCGIADENTENSRSNIDLHYIYAPSTSLKLVTGVHLQSEEVKSQTYYGGTVKQSGYQIFNNISWSPNEKWTANWGASYEYEQDNDRHFSPRFSLHHHLSKSQSIRFVWSEAIRTPDIFENQADWSYTVNHVEPNSTGADKIRFIVTAQAPGNLVEEEVVSKEIGYLGSFPDQGITVDFKLFRDRFTDLITKLTQLDAFDPKNIDDITQRGFEIELNYQWSGENQMRLTYAYIDAKYEFNASRENSFTPEHAGSLLWMWRPANGWYANTGYYYSGIMNNRYYKRVDFRIGHRWNIGESRVDLSVTTEHRLDNDSNLLRDNIYDSKNRFFLNLKVSI